MIIVISDTLADVVIYSLRYDAGRYFLFSQIYVAGGYCLFYQMYVAGRYYLLYHMRPVPVFSLSDPAHLDADSSRTHHYNNIITL